MAEYLLFETRQEFRKWLEEHHTSEDGVWLKFGKRGGPKTVKAGEALEEALCFGWIDGVMKKIDDTSYLKYFAARRKNSKWSEKNKGLVEKLEKQGLMTEHGRAKIAEARVNGQWEKTAGTAPAMGEEQIEMVAELLRENELAYNNFQAMSPSVRKTYTRAYFDAKTDAGREKRLAWMTDRLEKNLKPM